jgi:hypothetical protein
MNLFGFFKKKTSVVGSPAEPAYTFGGGDGRTIDSAIKVIPRRLEELRLIFKDTLGDELPPEMAATPNAIDGLIAEMCKMQWLEAKLGKEDSGDWKCGTRCYLVGAKQSQEVVFPDGRSATVFFDFSAFHPQGW